MLYAFICKNGMAQLMSFCWNSTDFSVRRVVFVVARVQQGTQSSHAMGVERLQRIRLRSGEFPSEEVEKETGIVEGERPHFINFLYDGIIIVDDVVV